MIHHLRLIMKEILHNRVTDSSIRVFLTFCSLKAKFIGGSPCPLVAMPLLLQLISTFYWSTFIHTPVENSYTSSLTYFANNNIYWLVNPCIPHHKVVMVPHAWKWIIHHDSLSDIIILLHSGTNQDLFKKHLCSATTKNTDGAARPSYHLKMKCPLHFFVSYV